MAITRTAMIDDDGSGTTGTILNNAWKQELYNQIDANPINLLRYAKAATANISTAGFDNYRPPDGENCPVWLFNPTMVTNITGILAEADLTQHVLINLTANAVVFHNQHASSTVGNRIICPGYATTYSLGTWGSISIIYLAVMSAWVLQKAT